MIWRNGGSRRIPLAIIQRPNDARAIYRARHNVRTTIIQRHARDDAQVLGDRCHALATRHTYHFQRIVPRAACIDQTAIQIDGEHL